jgi:uncharacterized phage-associated protein
MASRQISIFNVAKYVLDKCGPMTTMKLQKMCFYSQAWHVYFTGEPLFPQEFQAWANGPVCYELFDLHRGQFSVTAGSFPKGDATKLSLSETTVIDEVIRAYGGFTASQLSEFTHSESPWLEARQGLSAGTMSNVVISLDLMKAFCAERASFVAEGSATTARS